jgi:hypothetical protein
MRGLVPLGLAALMLATPPAQAAARRGEDPDWLCVQRLVPTLSAAGYWTGPDVATAGDWTSEPRVAELVRRVTPRRVKVEEGEAAIASFADALPADETRARLLTLAFAGILAETNRERDALITRIKELGRRQNELAAIAAQAGEELRKLPATAASDDAERRSDLEQRFAFVTRAFEGGQRTLTYVCEAPVQLEHRLGRYARALQARL